MWILSIAALAQGPPKHAQTPHLVGLVLLLDSPEEVQEDLQHLMSWVMQRGMNQSLNCCVDGRLGIAIS